MCEHYKARLDEIADELRMCENETPGTEIATMALPTKTRWVTLPPGVSPFIQPGERPAFHAPGIGEDLGITCFDGDEL